MNFNPPSTWGVMAATLVARKKFGWWRCFLLDHFSIGRDRYWREYLKARVGRV